MRVVVILIGLVTVIGCSGSSTAPASEPSAPAVDPASVATLTGQVMLEGTPPSSQVIRLEGDPRCVQAAAGEERRSEDVVVGTGGALQNVFVYVKEGLPPGLHPVPATPVVLDQQKCRYVPHVLGVQVGQQLTIRNSDALMHNVRADGPINAFDVATPIQGIEIKRTFSTREVMIPFKCNVHAWMTAYVGVLEHPFFAVTDSSGRFTIPRLPPGTYTIETWHERLGTQTQQITVAARDAKDLSFTYKAS